MMRVLLEAPILSRSGYGEHSRLVYESLKNRRDLDIFINPLNWGSTSTGKFCEHIDHCISKYRTNKNIHDKNKTKQVYDIHIFVGLPNQFQKKANYSVCVTAGIETDRVAPEWLASIRDKGISKVIVPSEHAKKGFYVKYVEFEKDSQGKPIPETNKELSLLSEIEVVPYPVKAYDKSLPKLNLRLTTDFNFLQIALLGQRKNIENSIKVFVETFRNNSNVGLIVKTSRAKSSIIDRAWTREKIQSFVDNLGQRKCKIYLLHGNMTEEEIHSLYSHPKIKAYYTLTHGEGYGLPIFEAAYSGMPIVATDWSGHLDFLVGEVFDKKSRTKKKKKLFSKVNHILKKVQKESVWNGIITQESQWAYPIENSAKQQINKIYKNYQFYQSRAKKLQNILLETHQLENIKEKMQKAILGERIYSRKNSVLPKSFKNISFCIPTNGKKPIKTKLLLNSIKNCMKDFEHEIIICGVVEPFKDIKGIKTISQENDANTRKVSKLRNSAASASKSDIIVWCDDDIILDEMWLESTLKFTKSNGWHVLGNKILNPDGSRCWDRAVIHPVQKLVEYNHPEYDSSLYQTSGFFAVRKEVFEKVKWDETKLVHSDKDPEPDTPEDVQYSFDLISSGFNLSFNSDATVWHYDDKYTELNVNGHATTVLKENVLSSIPSYQFLETSIIFESLLEELK
tara:strand:- start:681 stop:2723 length:2043 start_codon:yes stop_codon:yes gene_type:complete